ncbi:LacI family DNA-binding transcriptional regulator [soil metagenome]
MESSREGCLAVSERVTLLTLARDLGVSRATVSNAYNRPDQLSTALRSRILARAEQLGFAGPDPMARGLRSGRTGAVGVLIDQGLSYAFSDPTAVLYLDGLATELQGDGLGLLLHAGTGSRTDAELVRAAAVDAWVIRSLPEDEPAVEAAVAQQRPMVVLDQPDLPGVPLVGIDDAGGAAAATRHLVDLGHRAVSVLTMPLRPDGYQGLVDAARERYATYPVMRNRLCAVEQTLSAAGVDWVDVPVVECAVNDLDTGALGAYELLHRTPAPTAILALSDQLALGALRAAQEMGVTVPGTCSVVGFDDAPGASTAVPPLTTVAQPLRERGQAAGAIVRALLAGEPASTPARLPVSLVLRDSTAPPQR